MKVENIYYAEREFPVIIEAYTGKGYNDDVFNELTDDGKAIEKYLDEDIRFMSIYSDENGAFLILNIDTDF